MKAKRLVFLLAFLAAVGGFAACGGSPTAASGTGPHADGGSPALLTFSGTVRSGGAGLASVQVDLSGNASRSARTDSQGAFSFAGVSGNKFVVTPSLEGYIFNPSTYELGSTSRTDLDFTAAKGTGGAVGDTAPDFTALDQNGQTVSLYSYRGKVVLINISADWCGACRVEAPQLEALYQKYKDQGFQALTILVDGSAANWASTYKVTHPVIEDKSRSISNPYATGWFPTQVILDRTMIIRYKEGEDYDEDRIVALIKQYL